MICKTRAIGRSRVIDVDGKTVYPIAYMSYAPLKENLEAMKARGVRLFMFPVYAGDEGINMESGLRPFTDNFFKGYGEYDFSYVDKVLSDLFATGDEDIYVIPRVCLEPPIWWQRMHPEELSRDYRGEAQRESFSSKLWLEDMTKALYALIDHISAQPYADKVIGYHIAAGGTEEWAHHARYNPQFYDYSEVNLRAYRDSLIKKYGSVEKISAAHGRTYTSIESITFPAPVERRYCENGWLRDPVDERAVLDFFDFHNESVADAILYFCHAVKEYTRGERLTGVFYGYVFTMPQNYKGLHALGRVLASEDVDFLSTTNGDHAWHFSSAVESALMHGKMWICEGDIRTLLTTGMDKNLPHAMPDNDYYRSRVWRGPADIENSVWQMSRALARILTTPTGIWWFDMFGGWFNDPALLSVIEKSVTAPKHGPELFSSEVALVVDERGHKYSCLDNKRIPRAHVEFLANLDRAGFPYDTYLLSDIAEESFPLDKYRLIIFLSAVCPEDGELSAIETKLKRGGKTLLFLGNSSARCPRLSGFSLTVERAPAEMHATFEDKTYPTNVLPTAFFECEDGYVLSRFEDGRAAVIWKMHGDYNSVAALPLAIPSSLISHIALLSGVHLYNRTEDIAYAGGEYVALRAMDEGYRRIGLPEADCTATDILTGEPVTVNDRFIDMLMKKNEVRVLRIQKK
ncbi:MAG: beta-galactosidase [Clostridia bacterium]|nr:beta-galactosidase [Clostridia bacterium]